MVAHCKNTDEKVCVIVQGEICDNLCSYYLAESVKIIEHFYNRDNPSKHTLAYFRSLFDPNPHQSLSPTKVAISKENF